MLLGLDGCLDDEGVVRVRDKADDNIVLGDSLEELLCVLHVERGCVGALLAVGEGANQLLGSLDATARCAREGVECQ